MAQRRWYALIITENDGSWYGEFKSKRSRDDFCEKDGVWVLRNARRDWRGNFDGIREFVKASITPVPNGTVKKDADATIEFYY